MDCFAQLQYKVVKLPSQYLSDDTKITYKLFNISSILKIIFVYMFFVIFLLESGSII